MGKYVIHEDEITQILRSDGARAWMERFTNAVAEIARAEAPKRTGKMAAGIRAYTFDRADGIHGTVRVPNPPGGYINTKSGVRRLVEGWGHRLDYTLLEKADNHFLVDALLKAGRLF